MPRSKYKFSDLKKRAKKLVRKRHKKTFTLSEIKKLWNDWVEYAVVKPLLAGKKVQVDNYMTMEIVGKRIIDDPKIAALLMNGLNLRKDGAKKKATDWGRNRPGIKYKIEVKDTNYNKGVLIFEANPKLAKRVHKNLENTQIYYRIALCQ